jgi:general L-amino acid transport system substrate-binding protein
MTLSSATSVLGAGLALALAAGVCAPAQAGATLDAIKARGSLKCGVAAGGTPGFMAPDSKGEWQGFNVDTCRAVAVALFNDAKKVEFVPVTSQSRFPALQSGEIDVLVNNVTNTIVRDTQLGFNFAPTVFYDGQGFLVPKKLGVEAASGLNGATVCVLPGTTTELNLADYFRKTGMSFTPVVIESQDEIRSAYFSGRCDVMTNDRSALASTRSLAPTPADHVVLPDVISKEPLAPTVRHGDEQWADVVRWSVNTLIEAEEMGITSKNVDQMTGSTDPAVKRFLGATPGIGAAIGLTDKWSYNIVKTLGNYAEIYDRHLGPSTPIGLPRGVNALWNKGGLMYTPPFR